MARQPRIETRARRAGASPASRRSAARSRCTAACAAPASSSRAARGSCRTGPLIAPTAFCRNADALGQLRVRRDGDAADHVGVAVQILRRRMHHDVGAELQRPLHPRARERVVDDRENAALCARTLPPARYRPAAASDWSASRSRSCRVCGRTALDQMHRAVGRSTKLMSRFAERRRTRSNRRNVPPYRSSIATMWLPASSSSSSVLVAAMPEANAKPCVPLFEIGDAALPRHARRIARARVVVALVHARARLRIGRGRVDRRHHRARRGIRRLAGVNAAGAEACSAIFLHRNVPDMSGVTSAAAGNSARRSA